MKVLSPTFLPFPNDNFINEVKKRLLSKINLYSLPVEDAETLENQELAAIISEHEIEQAELSMRTASQVDKSVLKAQSSLQRLSKRVKESVFYKEKLTEVIDEAMKYNIPLYTGIDYFELKDKIEMCKEAEKYGVTIDPSDIEWSELEDVICSWITLLDEARSVGVYWREDIHAPTELQEAIDTRIEQERGYCRQIRNDYFNAVM